MTQLALDFSRARALKDQGMAVALDHAGPTWVEIATEALTAFADTRGEFTTEEFRFHWLTHGGVEPESHKAWGALTSAAAKRGLIQHTGRYRRALATKTHGHPVALWRKADLA